MEKKKMTKREMYVQIKSRLTDEDEIKFIDHEIELLDKKSGKGADKKLTPEQEKNEKVKVGILNALDGGVQMTISQMIKEVPEIGEIFPEASNQKISALVRQLVQALVVERVEVKGVAYFRKA
jgi:hypothetical protein